MSFPDPHPDEETLRAFALGKLQLEQLERVADHIEKCQACTQWLDKPLHETLIDQLNAISLESGFDRFLVSPNAEPNGVQTTEFTQGKSFEELQKLFLENSKYRLIEQVGSGGMGAVYSAQHSVMGRKVAIKIIRAEFVSNQEAVARFQQEVQSAARLSHRNIVTAFDADQVGDVHFLVMEFVEGESLAETVFRKKRLSVIQSCSCIFQAAMGLRHAHEQGMVHRDIKPQNLMKTKKGLIKVLDFGLARMVGPGSVQSELTSSGVLMGTANYIAPEQARDARTADIRSDLYSLGCTLYYLLSGGPPFVKEGYVEKVIAHCTEPFPDIRMVRDGVPDLLADIVAKLTCKDPNHRFQTPQELIDVLAPLIKTKTDTTQVAARSADGQIAHVGSATEILRAIPLGNANETVSRAPESVNPGLVSPAKPAMNSMIEIDARANPPASRISRRIAASAIGAVLLAICAIVWGVFSNGARPIDDSNTSGLTSGRGEVSRVMVVLSSTGFWFSDIAPLERAAELGQIELVFTSSIGGTARFDDADSATGKHSVPIDNDIQEMARLNVSERIDAVVFVGNKTEEFTRMDAVGTATEQILTAMQRKGKLIASIGKGSLVPIHYGIYKDAEIVTSKWNRIEALRNVTAPTIDRSVFVDSKNNIITAASFENAREFAEALITQMKETPSPR